MVVKKVYYIAHLPEDLDERMKIDFCIQVAQKAREANLPMIITTDPQKINELSKTNETKTFAYCHNWLHTDLEMQHIATSVSKNGGCVQIIGYEQ